MRFLLFSLLCFLTPALAVAQETSSQAPMELTLRPRDSVTVNGEMASAILNPLKCDARGNLYKRGDHPAQIHLAAPVKKISRDGKLVGVFAIGDAPGFEVNAAFEDFAFDQRGKVYLLAFKREEKDNEEKIEQVIAVYDPDGDYDSTITLEVLHHPGQLAVFPSGEFLVSGVKIEQTEGGFRRTKEPFIAIFDRQGRLIKELGLDEDVQVEDEQEEPAQEDKTKTGEQAKPSQEDDMPARPRNLRKLSSKEFYRALSLGTAVAADDGYIYLMRASSDPLVYVLARDGTVVRRLVVGAPSENSQPVTMYVAAGKVVVDFAVYDDSRRFRNHVMVVANAETGEILAHYLTTSEVGGALACYTPDGFAFFGSNSVGHLQIRTTYPY